MMGNRHTGSVPGLDLGVTIANWLQRLAADHDGVALIIAKTVGSLMIEKGPSEWHKLSHISALAGQPNAAVAAILYRLRGRRFLRFERRLDHDAVDHEYRFALPTKIKRTQARPAREDENR